MKINVLVTSENQDILLKVIYYLRKEYFLDDILLAFNVCDFKPNKDKDNIYDLGEYGINSLKTFLKKSPFADYFEFKIDNIFSTDHKTALPCKVFDFKENIIKTNQQKNIGTLVNIIVGNKL